MQNISPCPPSLPVPRVLVRHATSLAFNSLQVCRGPVLLLHLCPRARTSCSKRFHTTLEAQFPSHRCPTQYTYHCSNSVRTENMSERILVCMITDSPDQFHCLDCLHLHCSSLLFGVAVRSRKQTSRASDLDFPCDVAVWCFNFFKRLSKSRHSHVHRNCRSSVDVGEWTCFDGDVVTESVRLCISRTPRQAQEVFDVKGVRD